MWIKGLHVKHEPSKLLEENLSKQCHMGYKCRKDLNRTPFPEELRSTIDK